MRNFRSLLIATSGDHFDALNSSVIKTLVYDENQSVLRIVFHTGRVYDYLGVSKYHFDQLMGAASVGGYYNWRIKGQYKCEYVGDDTVVDLLDFTVVSMKQKKTHCLSEYRFDLSGYGVQRVVQVGYDGRYFIGVDDGNNLDGLKLPWDMDSEVSIEEIDALISSRNLSSDPKILSWWIVSKSEANEVPEHAETFIR